MDVAKTVRRARNDFIFAATMFAATAGSALWIANSMDEGERFDMHGRLPQTAEMHDFANYAEKMLLIPCAVFPLLSGWNLMYRRKKYDDIKEWAATATIPTPPSP